MIHQQTKHPGKPTAPLPCNRAAIFERGGGCRRMENPFSISRRTSLFRCSSHTAAKAARERGPRGHWGPPLLALVDFLTNKSTSLRPPRPRRRTPCPSSPPPRHRGHGGGPPPPCSHRGQVSWGTTKDPPASTEATARPSHPPPSPGHQGHGGGPQLPAATEATVLAHLSKPAPPRSNRRCSQTRNQGPSTVTGIPQKAQRSDKVCAQTRTQGSSTVTGIPT